MEGGLKYARKERIRRFKYVFPILLIFNILFTIETITGGSLYWLLTWILTLVVVTSYIIDKRKVKEVEEEQDK